MQYKAFIFDMDDTLYCEHEYVKSGFRTVATFLVREYSLPWRIEELFSRFVQVWQTQGRGRVFDQVCLDLGLDVNIKQLIRLYRQHEPRIELYEDACQCLSYLHKKQVPMALITDGDQLAQWNKIKALGLEQWIPYIVVTDELGADAWKPSPLPFRKAIQLVGLDFQDCVYIGDNPHKDFITAKKLGMHTVRIIRPVGDHMETRLSEEYEADLTISMLTELIPLLD